ncbi:MAG: ABC transporter permease [Candidatus Didemnitutus sp.]|nr:ABC transporter permease [Candidatus Didemnitutus sp.]
MNPLRRVRSLFRRRSVEAEMAEEMRFHLEQRAADFTADGLAAEEARLAAQRKFGNLASIQERARDAHGWRGLEQLATDLRLGVRSLGKSPGFTLLAVLTLSLGIGANTGMFGMIQTILNKPLPYPDSAQLVRLHRGTKQIPNGNFAPADFLDLRRASADLGEVAGYTAANASLSEPGNAAEMAYAARISANLFHVLGLPPQLGRGFQPDEETPGRDRVVVLSQRVWQRRYAGDSAIVGRTIRIDGEPHRIVGVMPEAMNDWRHLGMIDFFRPLAFTPAQAADHRGASVRVMLRRSANRPLAEIAGFVADFGARRSAESPEINAGTVWSAVPLVDTIAGATARPMFNMMIILSGLVLLIACSNLANLLLARTMARAREFAVRGALGASRLQLLRPLATESLLLALLGGGGAVLFAVWFRDYMAVRSRGINGESVVMEIGWPVLGWAFAAALVTALAFGVAPALFALRLDLNGTLKSGGRGTVGGRGHQRFRHALIVGQFAVAMTLLAAAGVQIGGLNELNNRRIGWTSDHLITGSMLLPAATYSDAEKISAFHRLMLEQLAALPGVTTVSLAAFSPFDLWADTRKFLVDGRDRPERGLEPAAVVNTVSPGYFDAYGTRLLAGRAFDARDTAQSPKVFIVSERTARALFGASNPLGQRIAAVAGGSPQWGEVVGVVADVEPVVNNSNLIPSQIYQPMAQEPRRPNEIAVRTADVPPLAVVDRIRETMAQLDPDLPVRQLQPADLTVERINYQVAVGRDIFSGMAALGLALAALGIYGVIARTMAQRTGEFAIRLALGAGARDISRLVLGSGLKLACAGAFLGLLGGFAICRFLAAANPAMRTNSTEVLVGATVLLVAVALLACWLPARRAGSINALDALRAE